jgi:site-specific recombinase XerD
VAILLQNCHKSTPEGLRDYTIICLILNLGLRASEVAKLTLDDIDWRNGEITVKGKGSTSSRLPLTQELGDDLVFYLQKSRPITATRFFFNSFHPPYRGLSSISITRIIGRAFKRASLKKKGKAHLLRHTFATRLLDNGASLQEVGRLLRHKSINTSAIYAKVDFNKLRSLVVPWPVNFNFGGV